MFELALVDAQESDSKKKHKRLEHLLSKAVDLTAYKRIQSSTELTNNQKRRLEDEPKRRTVLKKIHLELSKRHNPESTYEEWTQKTPDTLQAAVSSKSLEEIVVRGLDDDHTTHESSDDELETQLETITGTFDQSSTWAKANFLIRTRGLEVFPQHELTLSDHGSEGAEQQKKGPKPGLKRTHTAHVTLLLHLNMLRQNWTLAYKLFCVLIRIPDIDIRTIWPLGIEILFHKQREVSNSASETSQQTVYKDERFYDWLSSFYSTRWHHKAVTSTPARRSAAPVWRTGSRTHAPLYVISSLWLLLVRRQFSRLNDRLSELLLEPPYSTDGVFYFLLASSKLLQALDLKKQLGDLEADSAANAEATIKELAAEVENQLDSCRRLKFTFPEDILRNELQILTATDSKPSKVVESDFEAKISDSELDGNEPDYSAEEYDETDLNHPGYSSDDYHTADNRTPRNTPKKTPRKEGFDFDFDL